MINGRPGQQQDDFTYSHIYILKERYKIKET